MGEAKAERERDQARFNRPERKPQEEENTFARGGFTRTAATDKPKEGGPPQFGRSSGGPPQFGRSSGGPPQFGRSSGAPSGGPPQFGRSSGGPPQFGRSNANANPDEKKEEGGFGLSRSDMNARKPEPSARDEERKGGDAPADTGFSRPSGPASFTRGTKKVAENKPKEEGDEGFGRSNTNARTGGPPQFTGTRGGAGTRGTGTRGGAQGGNRGGAEESTEGGWGRRNTAGKK